VAEYIKFGLGHIFSTERSEEIKKLKNIKSKAIEDRKHKDQVEDLTEEGNLSEQEDDLW
jgi:predicted N-acetyltransferase YhbS